MPRNRLTFLLAVACSVASSATAEVDRSPGSAVVLRAEHHAATAIPVPSWDPRSPQRIVRIDGLLFQRQGDLFFPVTTGRISVRLVDGLSGWDDLVARTDGAAFEPLAELTPLRTNRLGIVDLLVPDGSDPVAWCELAHRTGLVRYAELASQGAWPATQSDPMYDDQWALHNTGQTGGTPGADMDAERAWDLTAGDPAIVVAILDSGTDIDHEDLAANVWHNGDEIPDNGIDDDGNGYVDDWEGWDFGNGNNDPRSTNYHGTHVAGIVNAAGSNGVGVAGLAGGIGGPGVRGMALAIGDGSPQADAMDDAILYAADNGAQVITISAIVGETQAINDALDYAYNTKDVFIDCASGNSGSSVGYPATRPEVMAVGATTHNDQSSGFSNPGPEVEVAAPGSGILSTQIGDSYGSSDGTSFAAPYVGGLAGLIRSRNPGLPAADVRQLIIDTAEDIEDPGFDEKSGHGRINAFTAVSDAADSDGTVRLDEAVYACDDVVGVSVSDVDIAGAGTLLLQIHSDSELGGESLLLDEAGAGSGVFRGSIPASTGPSQTDGLLQVAHADTVTVEYVDADNGQGGQNLLKSATASVDCVAPVISDVAAVVHSDTAATVSWTTDESADSVVRYGPLAPPLQSVSSAGFVVQHSIDLTGLVACTNYRYQVESADPEANTTVDDGGGAYHRFETPGNFPGVGIVPCHRGRVLMDRDEAYGCQETVQLSVVDIDLDTDPGVTETVEVLVTSTSEPQGEWVVLTENSTESNRFEGGFVLDAGSPVAGDGLLAATSGDLITATYHDAFDGQGPRIATDGSVADCAGPFITDLRVVEISATRAAVQWTTSEPATSRVEYGATAALGSVVEDPALVTDHLIVISGYQACDRLHFRVASADLLGNLQVADTAGQPLAFNFDQIGGLAYHETFESDTGWQLSGDWERGTPQGLGTNNADPSTAWSGLAVLGNDLSGQGASPGDYEGVTSGAATSPVFSTRQMRDIELILRRKLGVTSSDEAGIYVITNGTNQVWASSFGLNDDVWYERRFDISSLADNKTSVQIELRLDSSDPDHSFGWNVDEIIVKDSTEPDYLACGGCDDAPAFRGATVAYDPDPCASGGTVVEWEPAPAWGAGGSGTYDVHRGTASNFIPDASNRVASGLTGNTWTDIGAPVGAPVWYVVRARNDQSCAGGEGLADDNLIRVAAIETTALSLPAPVGATVVAADVGDAHVRLEWSPSTGADHYVVRRGSAADFSDAVEIGATPATLFEDAGAATSPESYFYRVFAVDACGRQE